MKLEIHLSKNEGVISIEKILLNVKEMGEYLGIGETKTREIRKMALLCVLAIVYMRIGKDWILG